MTTTPIEDRAFWSLHRTAVDSARAAGMDWWCAQLVGFAATNHPPTPPALCSRCQAKLPAQPIIPEVQSWR